MVLKENDVYQAYADEALFVMGVERSARKRGYTAYFAADELTDNPEVHPNEHKHWQLG